MTNIYNYRKTQKNIYQSVAKQGEGGGGGKEKH